MTTHMKHTMPRDLSPQDFDRLVRHYENAGKKLRADAMKTAFSSFFSMFTKAVDANSKSNTTPVRGVAHAS